MSKKLQYYCKRRKTVTSKLFKKLEHTYFTICTPTPMCGMSTLSKCQYLVVLIFPIRNRIKKIHPVLLLSKSNATNILCQIIYVVRINKNKKRSVSEFNFE